MRKRGIGNTMNNIKWTEKRLRVKEMRPEPSLNKEGFWKKPELPEIEISKDGRK